MTAATQTPAALSVPKANASGKIAAGWIDTTTFFATIVDTTFAIVDAADPTKKLLVDVECASGFALTLKTGIQTASRSLSVPVLAANSSVVVAEQANTWTFAQTFLGFVDASTAAAGKLGEEIKSTVAAAAVGATTVTANWTSIALTAGDWLVSALGIIKGGATGLTTGTTAKMSVTTTTGADGVSGSTMAQESILALLANGIFPLTIPQVRIRVAAPTTLYLTGNVTYAAGTPTIDATLVATRIR
jgi:hypothetical protein